MGPTHSDPSVHQNSSVTVNGGSATSIQGIRSGRNSSTQGSTATGPNVGVKVTAPLPIPELMQLQAVQNTNLWGAIMLGADGLGDDAVNAVKHCHHDITCRMKAEEGAKAIIEKYTFLKTAPMSNVALIQL